MMIMENLVMATLDQLKEYLTLIWFQNNSDAYDSNRVPTIGEIIYLWPLLMTFFKFYYIIFWKQKIKFLTNLRSIKLKLKTNLIRKLKFLDMIEEVSTLLMNLLKIMKIMT